MSEPLGYLVVRGGHYDESTLYVDRQLAEIIARELAEITGEEVKLIAVEEVPLP